MAREEQRERMRMEHERQEALRRAEEHRRREEEARKREEEAQRERDRLEQLRKEAEMRERELLKKKQQQEQQLQVDAEEKRRQELLLEQKQLLLEQEKAEIERKQLEADLKKKEEMIRQDEELKRREEERVAKEQEEERSRLSQLANSVQTIKLFEGVEEEIKPLTPLPAPSKVPAEPIAEIPKQEPQQEEEPVPVKLATLSRRPANSPKASRNRASTLGKIDPSYFTLRGRPSNKQPGTAESSAKSNSSVGVPHTETSSRGAHFWMGKEADFETDSTAPSASSTIQPTDSPKKKRLSLGFGSLRSRSSSAR